MNACRLPFIGLKVYEKKLLSGRLLTRLTHHLGSPGMRGILQDSTNLPDISTLP